MSQPKQSGPWMEAGREAGLVLAAQQGDRDSYLELASHYAPAMHRLAHALTLDDDDALDLCSEALGHGWRNIQHLPVGRPYFPWLLRATRSMAVTLRRQRAGQPTGTRTRSARERAFHAAFGELTTDEQLVLALRVVEHFTYAEIAEAQETPVRTALSRVANARDHLRQRLTGRTREAA